MAKIGRKYETWQFKAADGTPVPVTILMADARKGGRYHHPDNPQPAGVYFRIDIEELDVHLWDADPEALKAKARFELTDKLRVDWKPYLYVQIGGSTEILRTLDTERLREIEEVKHDCALKGRKLPVELEALTDEHLSDDEDIKIKLKLEVTSYLLATTPSGKKIRKQVSDRGYGRSEKAEDGWPETGLSDESYHDYPMRALVPDTPEMRAAINQISRQMNAAVKRLKELLATDEAEKTLRLVNVRALDKGSFLEVDTSNDDDQQPSTSE